MVSSYIIVYMQKSDVGEFFPCFPQYFARIDILYSQLVLVGMDPPFFCHQAWRTAFTSYQSPQSSWWKSSNVKSRMVSLRPSVDRQHWTAPWRCALSLVVECSWSVKASGMLHLLNKIPEIWVRFFRCNSWNTWMIAYPYPSLGNVAMSLVGTTVGLHLWEACDFLADFSSSTMMQKE